MRILVLGLRRSGTTIFWQTLRQDRRLFCLNEPFNPYLREVPVEIPNRSRTEFIRVFRKDPQLFWRVFAPIGRIEELQEDLNDRQVAYFRYLLSQSEHVALDETRCHFKVPALRELAPDAVLVHLHRSPAAMASSHLIPSGSGGNRAGWLTKAYGQAGFWTRTDRFNNWGIEELVAQSPESLFGQRLREIGLDPDEVYGLPAVGKLMAYWRVNYERIEHDGARCFGDRFISVRFEDFCARPLEILKGIYEVAGDAPPALESARVHPPHPAHDPASSRWRELYALLGLPEDRLPTGA